MFGRSFQTASTVFMPFVFDIPAVPSDLRIMHKKTRRQASNFAVPRRAGGFRAFGFLFALLCAAWLTILPTQAQVQVQTVVVLDFSVAPGIDPILGRKAADALAVELQRSGDYEVVARQRVEQAIAEQPGLAPPYNESTQARLAQAVTARGVFSGQVLAAQINAGRSARVTLEARLLDGATQDYVNGTSVSESTEDQLTQLTTEVLIDQALNKAAVTAVRRIKQQPIPSGTVLNTTVSDAELNVGARVGASVGQRYAVLRDVYNKSKDRVERIKIGEVVISSVEMDQSVARILGDNVSGVKTGDKIRLIFAPTTYAVSPTGVVSTATVGSGKRGRSNAGGLIGGIGALAILAAVFGLGGGGSNGTISPGNVTARTSPAGTPAITVNFSDGVPRLTVPRECIVGFLIYRGETPEFAAGPGSLIAYQPGASTSYQDSSQFFTQNTINVASAAGGNTTDPCPAPARNDDATIPSVNLNSTFTSNNTTVTAVFNAEPLLPGAQYFYRVRRLTTERRSPTPTTVAYDLVISGESAVGGGATALIKPEVVRTSGTFDTNFSVTINGLDFVANPPPIPVGQPAFSQGLAFSDTNIRFLIRISNDPNFATFFEVPQPNKAPEALTGEITFNLGPVQATGVDPLEPVFIRVAVTNPSDQFPVTVVGDRADVTFGSALLGTRSNASSKRRVGGAGVPGSPGNRGINARGGSRRTPASIVRH